MQFKSILRFKKIKTYSDLSACENHISRKRPTLNAKSEVRNINLISCNSLSKRIKDIFQQKKIKKRKNSVIAMEALISISPEYFNSDSQSTKAKKTKIFARCALKWLQKEFGENCISAVLHLDESTPHIHAIIVPIICNKESKSYSLTARELFNKTSLSNYQKSYCKELNNNDINTIYNKNSKAKHVDIKEYYNLVNKHKKLEVIENEIKAKLKYKRELEQDLAFLKNIQNNDFNKNCDRAVSETNLIDNPIEQTVNFEESKGKLKSFLDSRTSSKQNPANKLINPKPKI